MSEKLKMKTNRRIVPARLLAQRLLTRTYPFIVSAISAAVVFVPYASVASVVVHDTFSDGGWTDGSDPQDISWYKSHADIQLSITDDPVLGTGNALHADIPTLTLPDHRFVVGTFAPLTVGPHPGNYIRASFDLRLHDPIVSETDSNLRLGILSSSGTPITSDAFTTGDDDVGYGQGCEAYSSTFASRLKWHLGADIGGGGDGWLDTDTYTPDPPPVLNDSTIKHSVAWTITRLTSSSIEVMFEMDGYSATAIDSSEYRVETFDELVVRGSFSEPLDFTIDNVVVEEVPEPHSLLLMLGAWCLVMLPRPFNRAT